MSYAESSEISAIETELREAILSEFLKPELPADIYLLRHCQRFAVRTFDIWAAERFERLPRPIEAAAYAEFQKYLTNRFHIWPNWFFGCDYKYPLEAADRDFAPIGSPWLRCLEYCMLAIVDHGSLDAPTAPTADPGPRDPALDAGVEFLRRYARINGHFFLSFALRTRLDYWSLWARSHEAKSQRTRIIVDDRHKLCLGRFDEILKSTSIEKWSLQHRIDSSQVKDYRAGKFKGRVSAAKRAQIEAAILEST